MNTEDEIFLKQVELIKQGVSLLEDRIIKLNEINVGILAASDSEKEAVVRVFKVRSLKLYEATLAFIAKEVLIKEPERHFFLLSQVRTLLDIYAHLMHLLEKCSDENKQALVCIAYQLLTYVNIFDNSTYQKTLNLYKNFLSHEKFEFPSDSSELDFVWVRNKKLNFASKNKLLTAENIKKYSSNTLEVFNPKQTHDIYSHLSELMHGNPYYYERPFNRERFWVVAMSILTTAFLIELIDVYTLKKINPKDFRVWLAEVKKIQPEFLRIWKEKKTNV